MGFRITARGREAEVLLYAEVGEWLGGISAMDFQRELRAAGDVTTLRVRMNSLGGDVFDGLAIYQALASHRARKIIMVDSIAASIASVIAMAGDEITMARHAQLMLHEPEVGTIGTAQRHREKAERLEAMASTLADIYAARTKKPVETVRGWMAAGSNNAGTYFKAEQAVAEGLADSIYEAERMAAHYDPARHQHIRNLPADILTTPPARPDRDAFAARIAAQRARLLSVR
jgi:ATP-dependent Clp protease, protease subunit